MPEISVVIIARNEAHQILRCLNSVKGLAAEILVVDSMSTDQTMSFCLSCGCRVIRREFDGFGAQKQFAVDQAAHNWILSIDADEVITPRLHQEIRHIFDRPLVKESGFEICFSLVYLGRKLRYGGAGGDYHLRLFNRTKGHFTQVPIHEGIEVDGPTARLKGEILHYSYRSLAHHVGKLNDYSTLAAEGYHKNNRRYSRYCAIMKFPVSFIQFYLIKKGILDGYPGFIWSLMAAFYASLKIVKTIEMQEKK